MTVSRFTSFTKNLVICCYQITKIFHTTYGFAGASLCFGTHFHPRDPPRNSSDHFGRSRNGSLSVPSCCLFFWGFWISSGSRDGSLRTLSMILVLSLHVDAGYCVGTTASCDEDVRDVGEDKLEELVERPGTTNGT